MYFFRGTAQQWDTNNSPNPPLPNQRQRYLSITPFKAILSSLHRHITAEGSVIHRKIGSPSVLPDWLLTYNIVAPSPVGQISSKD